MMLCFCRLSESCNIVYNSKDDARPSILWSWTYTCTNVHLYLLMGSVHMDNKALASSLSYPFPLMSSSTNPHFPGSSSWPASLYIYLCPSLFWPSCFSLFSRHDTSISSYFSLRPTQALFLGYFATYHFLRIWMTSQVWFYTYLYYIYIYIYSTVVAFLLVNDTPRIHSHNTD